MTTSKETYELFHALRHLTYADLYYSSMIADGKLSGSAKQMIRQHQNRIKVNIRDVRLLVGDADREILDRDMLDPNIAAQFQNMNDMLTELPEHCRNQAEKYIESLFNVYKLNKK